MLRQVDISRVVYGLVAHELGGAGRRAAEIDSVTQWSDGLTIDEEGLGVDSLQRLDLAARVTQFFHLHETGVDDYLLVRRTLGEWVELVGESLSRRCAHLTFQTSGSTGAPKKIAHPLAALQRELDTAESVIGPRRRILLWTPPQHIYGFLFGALYAARLDAEVVDLRAAMPSAIGRAQPGDLLVATPHRLAKAFESGANVGPDVVALTSSAPAPAELWPAAQAVGLARLIEIYGSTETAGVGWRAGPDEPFRLFPHWTRPATAGGPLRREDGVDITPPDDIAWMSDAAFRPVGRKDDVIQIAGVNVAPSATRNAILATGVVADCTVRFDPQLGRLKAFAVPVGAEDDAALSAVLRDALARALPAAARPAAWSFGPELPRNPAGKLMDWPLAR